jgi:UMF1 family MFS transporter
MAWVDDLIGSKKKKLIALAALRVLGLALVLVEARALFSVLGCLLGIFVGPAQAAGRALMAHLAPKDLETEAFGLYELSGKVTVFLGPLLLGLATDLFRSQRVGMSTILLFFVAGFIILLPLREPR